MQNILPSDGKNRGLEISNELKTDLLEFDVSIESEAEENDLLDLAIMLARFSEVKK